MSKFSRSKDHTGTHLDKSINGVFKKAGWAVSPVLGDVPVAKGNKKYGEGGKTLVKEIMMRVTKPYKRIQELKK